MRPPGTYGLSSRAQCFVRVGMDRRPSVHGRVQGGAVVPLFGQLVETLRARDLAMTLVGNPRIIFLDEPTTGLDPRSRHTMWQIIRELVSDGAGFPLLRHRNLLS
ncbi:hypothetical protein GCM10011579_034710 [Streptomyces albiflavescens]|uniref:Uncharacterized protein n=1 Tax=Streptomyces albiflavescens TaxID=1623582 RepID=A0A917Y3B2_9ACTN|nr:hypothetical protein GCM10011579_034710 [Streptomyces albiflavescens]